MKKIIAAMLSFVGCLLLLVACNSTSNNDTPIIPDTEQTVKTYSVNVNYVYRDTIIHTLTDTKKEGEKYNYAKYKESIPDTYIENKAEDSDFPDDYPKGSYGYNLGVLNVTYQVKPKYEQYMKITTTNPNTNGRIIPFSIFGLNIGYKPYTVNDYDNEPVTFRLSEIIEIKLFNTYSFYKNRIVDSGNVLISNFGTIYPANNEALDNLVKVDMTECSFIEDLPSNFFSGIPSLKTVISNGCTKNLHQVGSNFLSDSENVEYIDFDFSALTGVGNCFLMNTLINCKSAININLSSIENCGRLFLYQRQNDDNVPTINLFLENTQWRNNWLVGDPYDTDYFGKYYSFVNLNVYTNYKGNIETALQEYIEAGVNVHIYDMPIQN